MRRSSVTSSPKSSVLFNGREMVCVSAVNLAATTLLELTEANCVPSSQNITVIVKAKASISIQSYTRDLALAAVFCFVGGVGLTLVVVYIVYFNLGIIKCLEAGRDRTGAEEEYKGSSAKTQTVAQLNLNKENQDLNMAEMGLETKLMLTKSNQKGYQLQPWYRERAIYDSRIGKHGRHFTCPHCRATVGGSAVVPQGGGDRHMGATLGMLVLGGAQPTKDLAMTDEMELRDQKSWIKTPEVQKSRTLSRHEELLYHKQGYDIKTHVSCNGNKQQLGGRNNCLPAQRNKPTHTNQKVNMVDNQPSNKDFQTEHSGALPNYQTQTVICMNCHRTYKHGQPGCQLWDVSYRVHAKRSAVNEGFSKQNPLTPLKTERNSNIKQSHIDMYGKHNAREKKSVTFNLERSEVKIVDVQKVKHKNKGKQDRIKGSKKMDCGAKQMLSLDHSKRHQHKLQLNGLLKVKLNLHPLKKSMIHPRKKSLDEVEQSDNREQIVSKTPQQLKKTGKHDKSKSNSQSESTEGMETSEKEHSTHKNSSDESHLSSKNKLTSKSNESNLEDKYTVTPKNKESYKQKKTTSKSIHQERLGGDHPKEWKPAGDEKTHFLQKITGGETEESSRAPPPSNLSPYQLDSKTSVGSLVQQVEQYKNQQGQTLITEVEHPHNLGNGVTPQRTLSNPQQSTTVSITEMESTSSFCKVVRTTIPYRSSPYASNANSLSVNLHTQPLSQIVSGDNYKGAMIRSDLDQFPAPQLGGEFTQLAQGPGSVNEQNISQLAKGPGSFSVQNISQLAQGPGSPDGQKIAQLVQGSSSLNGQNISQVHQGSDSLDGQNIFQHAQSPESQNGDNLSKNNSMNPASVLQEILASAEGSPRKIRLVMPEKTTNRPPSDLEKKIR